MTVLQSVPDGFISAVQHLNTFPQDLFAELCQDVIDFLQYSRLVSAPTFVQKLNEAGIESSKQQAQGAINALTFLFRSAAREHTSPEDLVKELKATLAWSEANLAVIKHIWLLQGKALSSPDLASKLLNVGQLVDMKWKLGVAMTSHCCKNLNSPFVTLTLTVGNSSGQLSTHAFEMTVPEFKNFSRQMKEMAAMLETV